MTKNDIQEELEFSLSIKKGSFYKRPDFGHRFDELKNELATEQTRLKTMKFAEFALKWMVDLGHITDLKAEAIYTKVDRLYLSVSAVALTGDVVGFGRFVEVGDAA